MPFFRPERALSQLLRHDPFFSPFLSRPSLTPLSRVFDPPSTSPFCAPFITILEDASRSKRSHSHTPTPHHSSQSTPQSSDASTHSTSTSSSSSTQPTVTRSERSNGDWLDRRGWGRHHRGHRHLHHHPMSVWSPLTTAPFPSLLNNIFTPFAPLAAALPSMPEMSVDMFSTPQAYSVHAAVPGLEKKDIKITVEDGVLTIEAERRESRPSPSTSSSSNPTSTSTSTTNGASQPTAEGQSTTQAQSTEGQTATVNGASSTPSTTGVEAQSQSQSTSPTPSATSSTSPSTSSVEEDSDVSFHHVESFYGRVERSVQLPEDAKVEELTAKYENGVVKIEIPRMQEVKKQGRKIEIQ